MNRTCPTLNAEQKIQQNEVLAGWNRNSTVAATSLAEVFTTLLLPRATVILVLLLISLPR
jgi:hypothetical protein